MPATIIRVFRAKSGATPVTDWLADLETTEPRAYVKCLALILELARLGSEMRRPASDYVRDGIRELRARVGRVNYRILYFFCARHRNTVCLSHGLTKEQRVPDAEIEKAIGARRLVDSDLDGYTAEWGT